MLQFSRTKVIAVISACILAIIYASPNFFGRPTLDALEKWPAWLPTRAVNLGLDLQGGAYLLLQVDTATVIHDRLSNVVEAARPALRESGIAAGEASRIEGRQLQLTLSDPAQAERAAKILRGNDTDLQTAASGGGVTVALSEAGINRRVGQAMEQSVEIVRRRIDETGTKEPLIQRQGLDRIIVQLPGIDDPQRVKRLLGQTAKLSFRLVDSSAQPGQAVPAGIEFLPYSDRGGVVGVQRRALVTGDMLQSEGTRVSTQNGLPVVQFAFDAIGRRRFGDATRDNVGRQFAIVLDNKVISAPVIREPIPGGTGIISGNFTFQSANELSVLLRAGALPAPLTVLEERTVGPGLGADSILAGQLSAVAGLILVIIFMIACYGLFGSFSVAAVFVNIAFIFAAMSLLGATLTLPGIAGVVLTIGMAVDANVLIFERMREEVRAGRSILSAIDTGYGRAMTAIVDSNLTTLIACFLLYWQGSGPVKGFAVTLTIGVLASMFTAIMLTRLMIVVWLRRTKPTQIPI